MGYNKLKIITSQSHQQWTSHGKYSIESFLKHWPRECSITVYTEDFDKVTSDNPRIDIVDLKTIDTEYNKFIEDETIWFRAKNFAHKAWAIMDTIKNNKDGFLIWIDCDVVTKNTVTLDWIIDICPPNCISAHLGQYQHIGKEKKPLYSAETGFFILNLSNKHITTFYKEYRRRYLERDWSNCKKPFDTDVYGNAMSKTKKEGAIWNELNPDLMLLSPFNKSILGQKMYHYKARGKTVMETREGKNL